MKYLSESMVPIMICSLLSSSCGGDIDDPPHPPQARVEPVELTDHGVTRVDDYYWLRERESPEVIGYLEAENAYLEATMEHADALRESLFEEMAGRIKQDDRSVPYRYRDYFYYTRYEEGNEYPIHARRRSSPDAEEEVMVDANLMAEGQEFLSVSVRVSGLSENQRILAFALDTVGRRKYTIRFKDLSTGEMLADEIPEATPNLVWANDDRTLFYTKQDPETLRWYRIYRHVLGTDPSEDELVYEEKDETFSTGIGKTKSRRYLMISSRHTLASEYLYLEATDPLGEFRVVLPRQMDHEYSVDHYRDEFFLRTNLDAPNFRLVRAPVSDPSIESWREVVPHREDVLVEGFDLFREHLVVEERIDGLMQIRVIPWEGGEEHYLDFGEPAYLAYTTANFEFDTRALRYGYTSLTTPSSTYDYDMASWERELLKRQEVLGGFDPEDYRTERLWAEARDGRQIPISLVYREGFQPDGTHPLLLYGYGSYGSSRDATFSSARLSLLDRGFVYAIAHVRGGEELGRWWYEEGKLLHKKNTFTDFIDCAEHLVASGYASPELVFAEGGSAGGLLMGAIVNMRPDLWRGVVARVPFVDVVTTMLDPGIPLTTSEYDEWGDPNQKEYFDYILSYSPYDNVEPKEYPNLLVTTGIHDSQVQYWEPAKWVAKLRSLKADDNLLLLHTNMEAGHGGASGRFRRLRETALAYAFLLDLVGASP
jgi:oligopeptidase B